MWVKNVGFVILNKHSEEIKNRCRYRYRNSNTLVNTPQTTRISYLVILFWNFYSFPSFVPNCKSVNINISTPTCPLIKDGVLASKEVGKVVSSLELF